MQIAWALLVLTRHVPLIPDAPGAHIFIRKVCPWLCLYIAVQVKETIITNKRNAKDIWLSFAQRSILVSLQ